MADGGVRSVRLRSIRGGMGLGDALYVQGVARHLTRNGERVAVCSQWPDVFRPLGDRVRVVPFRRTGVDVLAHYSLRKGCGTNQWQDVCIQAGIGRDIALQLDWTLTGRTLPDAVRAAGKPVLVVQLPRRPMNRADGFGASLLPDCGVIQSFIHALRARYTVVQIGAGEPLYRFSGIDVDLANRTSVAEMIDVVSVADACLGYVSFLVPLAESLNKRALLVWSRRGLQDSHRFVRQITPAKILSKSSSRAVMDDANTDQLIEALNGFL